MKNILKKAIEGGYDHSENSWHDSLGHNVMCMYAIVCKPTFWQALGKACGWPPQENFSFADYPQFREWTMGRIQQSQPYSHALRFHEINLFDGWEKAVAYLEEITK